MMSSAATAGLRCADALRREVEVEKERGEMERGLRDPIYKEKGNRWREKQGGQRMISQLLGRLDFWDGY